MNTGTLALLGRRMVRRAVAASPTPTLSINQGSTATITNAETLQLTATVSDGATPAWTSSNTSVVTVDGSGLVQFVGEGTATVTATHPANTLVSDSIAITASYADAAPTALFTWSEV